MDNLFVLIPLALLGMALGALLSAADAALLSTSRLTLERALEERSERTRRRVMHQYDDARHTMSAISLGRVFSEALMAVAVTAIVFERMDGWAWPTLLAFLIAGAASFIWMSVSPRTLGRRKPDDVLIVLSGLISVVRTVLGPPAKALIYVGSAFAPGGKVAGGPYATEAELRQSVDRALENEELELDERDMIQNVFDLGDRKVRELMVPRPDMITVAAETTAAKAMRLFVRSGYSRIPVIGEDVDDLLGMLYVKDVTRVIHSPWDPRPDAPVTDIMRPARFVPEFLPADDVLKDMQTARVHIAVVVDEYGGVSGIVTIEDIIEEIVGEIADEHDRSAPEIEDRGEGVYRVPARTSIVEVGELFGLEIEDEDVDSVAGLLGKAIERVPIVGSEGDLHGLHMEAERVSGRRKRVSTVLVSRTPREEQDEENEDEDD